MPEGDTVHKVARVIDQELRGHTLTEALVQGVYGSERLAGSVVEDIEAVGKHLLITLDCDLQLRVHLGMKGSWHRYPPGVAWKRSPNSASVVLKTATVQLICFQAMETELIPTPQRKWHRQLTNLGPDLLATQEPDWARVVKRVYELHTGQDLLGEILLDQRVAAGIGNVYKSELAFLGVLERDPFRPAPVGYSPYLPLAQTEPEVLEGLFRRARPLLQANLGGWRRTTRVDRRVAPAPRDGNLYVYGRVKENCYRCQGEIEIGFQGLQNRVTYWCGACQKLPSPEPEKPSDSG